MTSIFDKSVQYFPEENTDDNGDFCELLGVVDSFRLSRIHRESAETDWDVNEQQEGDSAILMETDQEHIGEITKEISPS